MNYMSGIKIFDMQGTAKGELDFPDDLLLEEKGEQAARDAVVAFLAGLRAGTASTLTKGEVKGSNRKPWRQKGLGRARAGYIRSPVWRGGGVVFGPKPRSYKKKLPRRVLKLAFKRALTEKIKTETIKVVENMAFEKPGTKEASKVLNAFGTNKRILIVIEKPEKKIELSFRNIPSVQVELANKVNTYQLLLADMVLATSPVIDAFAKRIAGKEIQRK
jgi:large subunit ribosomal protein L4